MSYLNLDTEYFEHIKIVRLVGLLGKGSAELPIRLMCRCAKYHTADGTFSGYKEEEIESLAGWDGEKGKMVQAMLSLGILEKTKKGLRLHGWEDRQGHLKMFHERAKIAAKKRWESNNATSIAKRDAKQSPIPYHTKPTIPNHTITIKDEKTAMTLPDSSKDNNEDLLKRILSFCGSEKYLPLYKKAIRILGPGIVEEEMGETKYQVNQGEIEDPAKYFTELLNQRLGAYK